MLLCGAHQYYQQINTEINQVGSGRTPVSRGYNNTERGRGAGRRLRGNHREGQIVNNNNVHQRQVIRNQISQAANRQNPIVNIRNNQTPRRIVFDSENFEISNRAPRRVNPRFKESNINYEVSFKDLPNNHQILQDIFYGCIDKLINFSFSENPNSMTRITIYHDDLETPIGFPYMHRNDITTEMIMSRFLLVSQSKKELKIENNLIITASTLDIVDGGSRLEDFVFKKDCIIKIRNDDNL